MENNDEPFRNHPVSELVDTWFQKSKVAKRRAAVLKANKQEKRHKAVIAKSRGRDGVYFLYCTRNQLKNKSTAFLSVQKVAMGLFERTRSTSNSNNVDTVKPIAVLILLGRWSRKETLVITVLGGRNHGRHGVAT